MKTRLLIIIGAIMFFSSFVSFADAVPELDPRQAFDYSEIVLIGEIISVEILSEPEITKTENTYSERSGVALYEVKVEEYLKNPSNIEIITIPGLFLREPHPMAYETYPYEVGQRVLLYLQENTHGIADADLIIRAGDSRVLENDLCYLGYYFDKGLCVIIDDSVETPNPPCKSGPSPGENFVFFDCNWVEIPYGWIFENGRWQEDPNIQRIGPQPLPSCPRIDICTCSGDSYYDSTDQQCHSSPYIPTEYEKSCKQYEQLEFDGWQFNAKYCDWIPQSDPYENEESMRLASEKVGVGGLGIDPVFDESTIIIGILIGVGSGVGLTYYWRKRK